MGSFPETYNDPNRLRIGSSGCTVHRLAKLFRSSYCAKVGERERERATMKRGMKGEVEGERKRFPANPTIL